MAVLRFLASLFLLVAVVALVADTTRSLNAAKPFAASTVQQHWAEVAPNSLASAKAGLNRAAGPRLWDSFLGPVLSVPTFVLFGLFSLVAGYLGRRRRRVDVFMN